MLTATNSEKPVFSISSAGKCPRALSAEILGYKGEEPPSWLETAAIEGEWHEQRIKTELRAEGFLVEDAGLCATCIEKYDNERKGIHVELNCGDFIFVGHMDGKVIGQIKDDRVYKFPNCQVLEVKSMSQFQFDKWIKGRFDNFYNYAAQVTVYMKACQCPEAFYIVKNRSSGYIDRITLKETPANFETICSNIQEVVDSVKKGLLVNREFDPTSIECRRCNMKNLICLVEQRELSRATELELDEAVNQWREGKDLIDKGKILQTQGKRKLEEQTVASGENKWRWNGLAINRYPVHKESYNKAKLEQIFPIDKLSEAISVSDYFSMRIDDLDKES